MDRRRALGVALAVASACGYGSGPLFAKGVYGAGLDWLALLAWRFLIGALLSWAWLLARPADRAALRRLGRRRLLALLGLGAFFVGNAGTYYAALETIPASLAALIVYVYPALVAVLAIRFGRALEGRRPSAALAIVMLGVGLTIGGIKTRADPLGLALICSSPLIYSAYILLSARLAGERPGSTAHERTGDAATRPAVAAAVMLTGTWAVVTGLAAAAREPLLPWQVPVAAWPGLLGIAVLSTALAIQAFYAATARIGAAQTSLVSTVEPVYTIVLATVLFGEQLAPLQVVGAGLVLGGVLLAQTTPGAEAELAAVREEP
ncbi:MAG TPA: DMT family transporter [Candidatus Limnocylindrales bacterium]